MIEVVSLFPSIASDFIWHPETNIWVQVVYQRANFRKSGKSEKVRQKKAKSIFMIELLLWSAKAQNWFTEW